ncbi:MAG TPA: type II 3-dehydroquinate dehydratase, partial [Burkholderiales bacterium]|nr:type II 3-dehydroquinate dehydratase [Burkholderiales bacterium]
KILILHGPNLNLFGRREPHIYGTTTLAEIDQMLEKLAKELKVELAIKQSNHEGELLDFLHSHMDSAAGAVINPGGLTQHGVSLHDCIKAMPFPCIETHMSNLATREEWRHFSIISSAVRGTVQGFGWRSYLAALRLAVEIAQEKKAK